MQEIKVSLSSTPRNTYRTPNTVGLLRTRHIVTYCFRSNFVIGWSHTKSIVRSPSQFSQTMFLASPVIGEVKLTQRNSSVQIKTHWLCVPQSCGHGVSSTEHAPLYLDQLVRVADIPGRHRLHSSSSHRLQLQTYRLATIGRCSFPVPATILWNSLPSDIQSSASLTDFCHN